MAKTKNESSEALVFYRIVKALPGHPFAGLYAVEEVYIRNDKIYKKLIAHEWDMRAFSEAALARLGGSAAYQAYKEDHNLKEEIETPKVAETAARDKVSSKDVEDEIKGL
jgi:nitrogen fixation/metabolism regulation signal transduction histidine kinase